jgi:transcription elongation GreA/GreB family factor
MLKKKLHNHCENYIRKKLKILEKRKNELKLALESEDKRSAGDKHETGRAMIQLEREKIGIQISENEQVLKKYISCQKPSNNDNVRIGSIVITTNLNYYLSIPAEFLKIDSNIFYCVSPLSPIGKLLLGKKVKAEIYFNKKTSKILEIM